MNKVRVDTRKANNIMQNVDGAVLEVIEEIGAAIVEEAQRLAPVDEGELRLSIYMRTPTENNRPSVDAESGNFDLPKPETGTSVTVGPSVMHGIYQELGTSKMAAQPYMAPAAAKVKQNMRQFNSKFGKALSDG